MPTHQRLGSDDGENLHDRWKPAVELDEKPSVGVRQPGPTLHLAEQTDYLFPQRGVLGLKAALGLEQRSQDGQHKADPRDHTDSKF